MAFAGTDPSSEEPLEKKPTAPSEESSLASAELVFPLKSVPLMITGLPESLMPLHGPETLSEYKCQYPSCNHEFSQKSAAVNHVCHNHLNAALACLYCSFNNTPTMHCYNASAQKHYT